MGIQTKDRAVQPLQRADDHIEMDPRMELLGYRLALSRGDQREKPAWGTLLLQPGVQQGSQRGHLVQRRNRSSASGEGLLCPLPSQPIFLSLCSDFLYGTVPLLVLPPTLVQRAAFRSKALCVPGARQGPWVPGGAGSGFELVPPPESLASVFLRAGVDRRKWGGRQLGPLTVLWFLLEDQVAWERENQLHNCVRWQACSNFKKCVTLQAVRPLIKQLLYDEYS